MPLLLFFCNVGWSSFRVMKIFRVGGWRFLRCASWRRFSLEDGRLHGEGWMARLPDLFDINYPILLLKRRFCLPGGVNGQVGGGGATCLTRTELPHPVCGRTQRGAIKLFGISIQPPCSVCRQISPAAQPVSRSVLCSVSFFWDILSER